MSSPPYQRYPAPGPSRRSVWILIVLVVVLLVLNVAAKGFVKGAA